VVKGCPSSAFTGSSHERRVAAPSFSQGRHRVATLSFYISLSCGRVEPQCSGVVCAQQLAHASNSAPCHAVGLERDGTIHRRSRLICIELSQEPDTNKSAEHPEWDQVAILNIERCMGPALKMRVHIDDVRQASSFHLRKVELDRLAFIRGRICVDGEKSEDNI
jgi:hypothetical protein